MSVGPSDETRTVKETPMTKVGGAVSSIVKTFKEDTAARVFYFGVAFGLILTAFGQELPYNYFLLLAVIGCTAAGIALWKQFMQEKTEKK